MISNTHTYQIIVDSFTRREREMTHSNKSKKEKKKLKKS